MRRCWARNAHQIVRQPSNNLAYIAMNVEKKPFDNVLVRRAVAQAIDIPAILRRSTVRVRSPATTGRRQACSRNPRVKIWPHDVTAAKALLAQRAPARLRDDALSATTPRPYMPDPQRLAEAIQADLKDAGIIVTLEPLEFGVFLSKVQNGEHPMCLIGWSGDNGESG